MGETAANILAPSDPTWNPPPMPVPDTVANPNPPSPDMLAARGTSDMPPAPPPMAPPDPNMITPAGAAAPYTPPQPAPPNPEQRADEHESFLHKILDKVGTILGGDETIHVTRDKDGNLTVTHDPSTTGEKWGRVAKAALGGAAQGLANSQGPGGLAKAASAGAQWGMQLPQQMREDADAQVTADQKRQMMNANNALVHQRAYTEMLNSQGQKLDLDAKSRDILNDYNKELKSDPYAKDFGVINGPDDLMRIQSQNPDFLHNHTNLVLKASLVPRKDGNGFELHAVATDPGDDARPVEQGAAMHIINVDPKTGDAKLGLEPVAKGSRMTKRELRIANQATDVQFAGIKNNYNKANKPPAEKAPTVASLALTAASDPDPQKRADARKALDLAKEKPGTGTETEANPLLPTQTGATTSELPDEGTFLGQFTVKPPPQGQAILDKLPTAQANLVQRFGNYLADEKAELPRGKERGPFLELVSAVYPTFDSAHYEARRDLVKSLTGDGKMAQSRNALNLTIQHMGEMWDAMQKVNPGEHPIANITNRGYHLAAGFGDKTITKAYGSYSDANEGVASEMARVFKGGAPTQGEVDRYRGNADITAPRSSQEGSFQTRAHMLASRMEVLNRQLQEGLGTPGKSYQLLTPEAIETLRKLPGGNEVLTRAGAPAAAPAAPKPAAQGNTYDIRTNPTAPTLDVNIWSHVNSDKLDRLPQAIQAAKAKGWNVLNVPNSVPR